MATRTAYYICTRTGYKVFESDKTTEIGTYKEVSLHWNDTEVGDEHRGVFNDKDNSFTFDSGSVIQL